MVLRFIICAFLVIVLVALDGCAPVPSTDLILFDFEDDGELDRVHWKCGTLFSLSEAHAFRGGKSLKVELFPSVYPGLCPLMKVSDWRGYTGFALEIYNPASEPVILTLRMDDKEMPDYGERFNGRIVAGPGKTSFVLPFESLVTSGTHRPLNLKRIQRWVLFASSPEKRLVLYIDHVRLLAGISKEEK